MVAAIDVTVLLLGETGTGKHRMARAIHRDSPRHQGPFIPVDCGSLTEDRADELLFGRVEDTLTGNTPSRRGYITAADGGTLFLDEVGELPLTLQAKLLRFIESGEFRPVGQTRIDRVDVRVVAATNRDLALQVKKGQFRPDLYYRLHVVPLDLPPLRARTEDLEPLLTRLTAELAGRHGLAAPRYTPAALDLLRRHCWPGNIRELRNFAERMLALLPGTVITPENLPVEIRQPHGRRGTPTSHFDLPPTGIRLEDLEVDLIRQALARTSGNRSRAARLLGLTRDTLLYRIKKYAL
jgi:DNA-binding NtrC family response regulator